MLRIHKSQSRKKLFFLVITSICGVGALLGFSMLNYTPELSHAESITYKKTIDDITYMQEMTSDICENSKEGDTKQLIDSRDGKKYWVEKLRDNNCWMVQNLDLDLWVESDEYTGNRILTPEDSDVSEKRILSTGKSQMWDANTVEDFVRAKYYDAGTYVYKRPVVGTECPDSASGLAACNSNDGWTNVSELKASDDSGFYKNNGNLAINGAEYDAHYLAGNYYTWCAATAGSCMNTIMQDDGKYDAPESICPRGWRLPAGGQVNTSGEIWLPRVVDKSVPYLLRQYGWPAGEIEVLSILHGSYDFRLAPFYYVAGGVVAFNMLNSAGEYGEYFASTDNQVSGQVGGLIFFADPLSSGGLQMRSGSFKYFGNSLRCVNRAGVNSENVEITVPSFLSLDIVQQLTVEGKPGSLSTGTVDVGVVSNRSYSVKLKTESGKTALSSEATTATIPTSTTVRAGRNGWGMKKKISATDSTKLGDDTDSTAYSRLTSTSTTYYQSAGAEVKDLFFTVGIGTASDLPSGIYSTKLIVTATQN